MQQDISMMYSPMISCYRIMSVLSASSALYSWPAHMYTFSSVYGPHLLSLPHCLTVSARSHLSPLAIVLSPIFFTFANQSDPGVGVVLWSLLVGVVTL